MSYRKSREPYAQSDHDFVNAVRACLGLAPLPSRGRPNRKNSVLGSTIDYDAAMPSGDGNRRVTGSRFIIRDDVDYR